MSDEKKSQGQVAAKAIEVVTRAGVAAVGAAVHPPAVGVALLAMLPNAVGLMLPKVFERQRAKVDVWWRTIIEQNVAEAAVRPELEVFLEREHAQDAVYASLRSLLDAGSQSAAVPLALLVREYVRADRPVDRFFHGPRTFFRS